MEGLHSVFQVTIDVSSPEAGVIEKVTVVPTLVVPNLLCMFHKLSHLCI